MSEWEAKLISAPGDGISPAILLTVGVRLRGQYLFEVPEGFARLALEHRIRPSGELRAIFSSGHDASLLGFSGLLMRLRKDGHGHVQVVGPPGTIRSLASLRHFIQWKYPSVLATEIHSECLPRIYEDEHISVVALWEELGKDRCADDWPSWSGRQNDTRACSPPAFPSAKKARTSCTTTTTIATIASTGSTTTASTTGNTTAIPLQNSSIFIGKGVTTQRKDAGAIVPAKRRPSTASVSDVLAWRDKNSQGFMPLTGISMSIKRTLIKAENESKKFLGWIIDVKSTKQLIFISCISSSTTAERLTTHPMLTRNLSAIICSIHILYSNNDSITELRRRIPGAHHSVGSGAALGHLTSTCMLAKLQAVSKSLFPLPPMFEKEADTHEEVIVTNLVWTGASILIEKPVVAQRAVDDDDDAAAAAAAALPLTGIANPECNPNPPGNPPAMLGYCILKSYELPHTRVQENNCTKYDDGNKRAAALLRRKLTSSNNERKGRDPTTIRADITFLGTGCAEPSKYRGASGILLRFDCGQCALLDCGEGSVGAMYRALGAQGAQEALASLTFVWISHRHADHMAGVLRVVIEVAKQSRKRPPLLVIGPHALCRWFEEHGVNPAWYDFIHCTELQRHQKCNALWEALHVRSMHAVPVHHCSDSYGMVLRHGDGWSLAYSGDTRPCTAFIEAAKDVTLMIHEATFDPSLSSEALRKKHSTTEEALKAGEAANAKVILTHFSQRYPKVPDGLPALGTPHLIGVAVDGMRVPLAPSILHTLPNMLPAMEQIFLHAESNDITYTNNI